MAIGYRCGEREGNGCGKVFSQSWRGRCQNCGDLHACKRVASHDGIESGPPPRGEVVALGDVTAACLERIPSCFPGFDRILGRDPMTGLEGLAARGGQAVQFFGEPGIGKTSLLLQILRDYAKQRETVLYVAAEESVQQIKANADRFFDKFPPRLLMYEEQDLDSLLYKFEDVAPSIIVIDSINALSVEEYKSGSTAAIALAANEIYRFTKARGIGLYLVTQMDKAGTDYSGPKVVEHIVDTSLCFRMSTNNTRILECKSKNRLGLTPAMQRFEMTMRGLVEVAEPMPEPESPDDPPALPPAPPETLLRSVP